MNAIIQFQISLVSLFLFDSLISLSFFFSIFSTSYFQCLVTYLHFCFLLILFMFNLCSLFFFIFSIFVFLDYFNLFVIHFIIYIEYNAEKWLFISESQRKICETYQIFDNIKHVLNAAFSRSLSSSFVWEWTVTKIICLGWRARIWLLTVYHLWSNESVPIYQLYIIVI